MRTSDSIGALAKALADAQAEIRNAVHDRVNPHFRNRYATLASVRDAVTPALAKHGLAVVQVTIDAPTGHVAVETTMLHASGEWIAGLLVLPVAKADAQGYGSALTYARRYALAAICGVASDEDDDGEAAVAPRAAVPAAPAQHAAIEAATADAPSEADLVARMEAAGDARALAAVAAEVSRGKVTGAARKRLGEAYRVAVARLAASAQVPS